MNWIGIAWGNWKKGIINKVSEVFFVCRSTGFAKCYECRWNHRQAKPSFVAQPALVHSSNLCHKWRWSIRGTGLAVKWTKKEEQLNLQALHGFHYPHLPHKVLTERRKLGKHWKEQIKLTVLTMQQLESAIKAVQHSLALHCWFGVTGAHKQIFIPDTSL